MHSIIGEDKNYFFLYSGGLDSSYGLMQLLIKDQIRNPINLIFFDYGQSAAKDEWQAVQKVYIFLKKNFDAHNILQRPLKFNKTKGTLMKIITLGALGADLNIEI